MSSYPSIPTHPASFTGSHPRLAWSKLLLYRCVESWILYPFHSVYKKEHAFTMDCSEAELNIIISIRTPVYIQNKTRLYYQIRLNYLFTQCGFRYTKHSAERYNERIQRKDLKCWVKIQNTFTNKLCNDWPTFKHSFQVKKEHSGKLTCIFGRNPKSTNSGSLISG